MKSVILILLSLTFLCLPSIAQKKARPMAPIKDDPTLPRVLLIGDSISIAYTLPTRAELKGIANVHRIRTNGGPTSKGLTNIDKWLGDQKWDVIHFNWGLHDLCYRHPESKVQGKRDKVNGTVTHSIEEYAANLENLVQRLEKTGATLIFATTTPVPEGEAGRKLGDDVRYNKSALAVMEKHQIQINDLHSVMAGKMPQFAVKHGDVHFKPAGSKLLADQVATSIKSALKKNSNESFSKPNVVLFLVDDMGPMDTSLALLTDQKGQPQKHPLNKFYRTPNMERLAAQGTRFSQFYAHSVCSPTRISIMNGQNAARHRTTNWIRPDYDNASRLTPKNWNWKGLTKNDLTFPRLLQKDGYRTIHIGKAHFGPFDHDGQRPENLGFEVNIAGDSIGRPASYYGEKDFGNKPGKNGKIPTHAVKDLSAYHGTSTFLTEALTLEAKKEITKAKSAQQPFFLHFAHYALHSPFDSDPRFAKNYADSGKPKRAQAYATLVEGMDKSLGDLLDHLESEDLAENTLIIFLGDNGGDSPLGQANTYGSSTPLLGKKGSRYEGGTRVPFIAAWAKPDSENAHQQKFPIAQNATQTQLGTILDLFPTILDVTGQAPPENHHLDGHTLKIQLTGNANPDRPEVFLNHFPHEHRSNYYTAYRDGDWKLIYNYLPTSTEEQPRYELFNLKNDPFETTNLATKNPEKLKNIFTHMMTTLKEHRALFPIDQEGKKMTPVSP